MAYVRVKDESTGHEFDVPETDPRVGKTLKPVSKTHYPLSPVPRRPKHNASSARSKASSTMTPSKTAEKEADHG